MWKRVLTWLPNTRDVPGLVHLSGCMPCGRMDPSPGPRCPGKASRADKDPRTGDQSSYTTLKRVGGYRLRFRWTSNWGRERNPLSPTPAPAALRGRGAVVVKGSDLGTDGEEDARTGGSGLCPSQCSGMVPCEASLGRRGFWRGVGGRGTARCGRIYPAPGLGERGGWRLGVPGGAVAGEGEDGFFSPRGVDASGMMSFKQLGILKIEAL